MDNFSQGPSQPAHLSHDDDGGSKREEKTQPKRVKKRKRRGKNKTECSSSKKIERLESMSEKFESKDVNCNVLLLKKRLIENNQLIDKLCQRRIWRND